MASGTNGTPSFLVNLFVFLYVSRAMNQRPGIGHSLMPSFSTISRCTETNAISSPGITKTCKAKKRDSVSPAMIGPPSNRCTTQRQ